MFTVNVDFCANSPQLFSKSYDKVKKTHKISPLVVYGSKCCLLHCPSGCSLQCGVNVLSMSKSITVLACFL